MHPSIAEPEARTSHQVPHGTGNHDLVRIRGGGDARADVNRDTHHLVARQLAFAGMQARADLKTERMDPLPDRSGTANRARRAVEGSE
jgi:hypothetical protein